MTITRRIADVKLIEKQNEKQSRRVRLKLREKSRVRLGKRTEVRKRKTVITLARKRCQTARKRLNLRDRNPR